MFLTYIIIALIIDVVLFTQADRYIWSAALLIGEAAGLWYLFPFVHEYVGSQTLVEFTINFIPVYIGIGILVAALKWIVFNVRLSNHIQKLSIKWATSTNKVNYPEMSASQQFYHYLDGGGTGGSDVDLLLKCSSRGAPSYRDVHTKDDLINALTPKATNYIDRIGAWIIQWPVVMIAFVFEDIVLKVADLVSSLFSAIFGRFSRYLITNATKNIM